MFCSKCGNKLDGSAKFCPKCGAQQSASVAPVQPSTPAAIHQSADNASLGRLIISGSCTKKIKKERGIISLVFGVSEIAFALVIGIICEWNLSSYGLFLVVTSFISGGCFLFDGITRLYNHNPEYIHTEIFVFENGIKGICLSNSLREPRTVDFQISYNKKMRVNVFNDYLRIFYMNRFLQHICYLENAKAVQQAIQERLKQAK